MTGTMPALEGGTDAAVALVAGRLAERGVRRGDRVVVSAPNTVRTVTALFAVMRLGCSLALVDHRQPSAARQALAASAAASWVLTDDRTVPGSPTPVDGVDGPTTLRLDQLADAPERAETARLDAPTTDDPQGWFERDDALVLWTSGTTGPPKSIVRSGPSILRNIERTRARMGYRDSDVLLPLLPLSHQYGLSVLLLGQAAGCGLVVCPPHRIDYALRALARFEVTVVDAAPPSYEALLRRMESPEVAGVDPAGVRMWCVGGAPLGPALRARFRAVTGTRLLDGYGSSELGNVALASPEAPIACGPALDDVEVAVVGPDGDTLPAGEVGELVVRSPDAMTGVLGPDGAVVPVDRSEHRTQDVGSVDAQGNVTVLGRNRAVHRLGHTLYPEQLAALAETRGAPVAVVDVQDALIGVQLTFVVADPHDRSPAHWRSRFAEVLADYERPNRVVVVDRLPATPNGKTDSEVLRAIVTRKAPGRPARGPGAAQRDLGEERLPMLAAVADVIKRRREDVRGILLSFSHHGAVDTEIAGALATLDGAAHELATHRPRHVPTSAVFMPSNMLLYGYVLYLAVPSLFVGRTHFRPSRKIDVATAALHELISAEVDVPWELQDCSQREFLEGPVAEAGLVVMTGTYANAEQIRRTIGPQQLYLFFGQGLNPVVVGSDADLDAAVADVVRVRTYNSGQDCYGPDQILVDAAVADDFLARLCAATARLRFGPNGDPCGDYGPLYYEDAFGASIEYLRRHADRIVSGAEISIPQRRLTPTVLDLPLDASGVAPEMFAPIFNVVRWTGTDDLHAVLQSAWFSERSMGAMVYGSLPGTVELLGRRHTVCRDSTLLDHENGNEPFGGRGIMANYVGLRGKRTAEPILVSQAVAEHLGRQR